MPFQHLALVNSPYASAGLIAVLAPFILIAVVWTLALKGFSLWYAARGSQKGWFIALLVVNTFGILEIIYLIWFRPKTPPEASAPVVHSSSVQSKI